MQRGCILKNWFHARIGVGEAIETRRLVGDGPTLLIFRDAECSQMQTKGPQQLPRRFELPACSNGEFAGYRCCILDDSGLHAWCGGDLRKSTMQYHLEVPRREASSGFLCSAFHMYTSVRVVDRTLWEAHAETVQVRLHWHVDF